MKLARDIASRSLDAIDTVAMTSVPPSPAASEASDAADPRIASPVVLQPRSLQGDVGIAFQQSLAQAINQAEVILVDLIWIEAIDASMLALLLDAMQQAADAGRSLSFLALDAVSQKALDQLWEQDIITALADRQEFFAPDFEQFLADCKVRKTATMLAADIASKRQW